MSAARHSLIARVSTLERCVSDPIAIDGLPVETQRNEKAALIRSGLAVMAFAIAEAFLRDRVSELLGSFDPGALSFSDLSPELQKMVTIGALEGVRFRGRFQPTPTKVAWTLSKLPPIASSATNISSLSGLSFGNASPNLQADDIRDVLKAFGVEDAWNSISRIAGRIGLGGILDYQLEFKSLASRRHAAAHDVSSQILQSEIAGTRKSILGVCVPFDLLLSQAHALHNRGQPPHRGGAHISHSDIRMRLVEPHPKIAGAYRELTERHDGQRHVYRIHANQVAAESAAMAIARTRDQHVVSLDASGVAARWITW